MFYIVLDNQKASKNTFRATKVKVKDNSMTFRGFAQKFKDLSRKNLSLGILMHQGCRTQR